MSDPAVPVPPLPTIDVNKHGGTMPAAAANLGDEADLLIINAGYTLHMPPQDVAVAANVGLVENQGTVSAPDTRGIRIEAPTVPGLDRLSVRVLDQAGVTRTTVALSTIFSSCSVIPQQQKGHSNSRTAPP